MESKIRYKFSNNLWQHNSPGGWHFISLPKSLSKEIRENLKWQEEGWGRMKVIAEINNFKWDTAIWFDTKLRTYILPIKYEIRQKAHLIIDEIIDVIIWL